VILIEKYLDMVAGEALSNFAYHGILFNRITPIWVQAGIKNSCTVGLSTDTTPPTNIITTVSCLPPLWC